LNYYQVVEEFLKKQKREKEKIYDLMDKKVRAQKFFPYNCLCWFLIASFLVVSEPSVVQRIFDTNVFLLTLIIFIITNILTTLFVMFLDNIKINKQIRKYIEVVNEYNNKLHIGSVDEIEKLKRTYELILLNSDIEYYEGKYKELFNEISKYEFHIAQIEKHINIAKKLCERIGVNFDRIIIDEDMKTDEMVADININKDVYGNECYDIMHFLTDSNDYCLMLNSGEILERLSIKNYIKSINLIENEVYKF